MPLSDLIIIIILILGVSAIVGLNIVNVIDKKLSYITINIPSIEVPEPHIEILNKEGFTNVANEKNKTETEEETEENCSTCVTNDCTIKGANFQELDTNLSTNENKYRILYKKNKIKVPFSYNAKLE